MSKLKLGRLKPRTAALGSRLPTVGEAMGTKRVTGRARVERNRRLMQLSPLCVECAKLGIDRGVDEFDHIIPLYKGGRDDESNLQGLCFDHHREKSEREEAERRRSGERFTIA